MNQELLEKRLKNQQEEIDRLRANLDEVNSDARSKL